MAQTGIDGLNLVRTVEPAGIRSFCDLVVPELQNRGLFKTAYRPGTMRQKMFPGRTPGCSPAIRRRRCDMGSRSGGAT
ncbi:hypothetical protein ACFQ4K_32595 [Tistrella bauzanensis]